MSHHGTGPRYTIDDLTQMFGLTRRTIHWYTSSGAIPRPFGSGRGAYYTHLHVAKIRVIRKTQDDNLTLGDLAERDRIRQEKQRRGPTHLA